MYDVELIVNCKFIKGGVFKLQVKIFTTTTCPFCKHEKAYLDSKGIKYENVFVDEDEKAAAWMIEESGQMGVPFTIITKDDGSKVEILGFDRGRIDQALGLS